jgi:hypothetical protein
VGLKSGPQDEDWRGKSRPMTYLTLQRDWVAARVPWGLRAILSAAIHCQDWAVKVDPSVLFQVQPKVVSVDASQPQK